MCIFCGGQCGGIGDFFISIGLPLLGLYLLRMKNAWAKIKGKISRRDSSSVEGLPDKASKCSCGGESLRDCREISTPSLGPKNLELLEVKSHRKEPEEISNGIDELNGKIKLPNAGEQKRVRGWLLLLCLTLTIFIPALRLYEANSSWVMIRYTKDDINLLLFVIAFIAIMLFSAIFSFYAGLSLWSVKQTAIKTAKLALIIQLFPIMIVIIRPFMIFPLEGNEKILLNTIKTQIPSLLHFTVWYLYLIMSRRVVNTYSKIDTTQVMVRQLPAKLPATPNLPKAV